MKPTRVLMSASAITLGALGALATFVPERVLGAFGAAATPGAVLLGQVVGALYLGFASLNWMSRDNILGGIYSRPQVVANLVHYLTAGIALLRGAARNPDLVVLWPLAVMYALFAAAFGVVMFRHPLDRDRPGEARKD